MKAHQARELALKANLENVDSQYSRILLSIRNAANSGKYEMWWYDDILPDVRAKLMSEGYKIGPTNYDPRERGSLIKITW